MTQRFGFDTIGKITKLDEFTIQMNPSVIELGGKTYTSTNIILDIRTSGLNGLDAGSIESSTTYNLFAVLSSNQVYLIASKLSSPTGYSIFKLLGKFRTSADLLINFVVTDYLENSNVNLLSKTNISNNLNFNLRDFLNSSKKNKDLITKESSFLIKTVNSGSETTQDYFGYSVAISGDYAVVGAIYDDGSTEAISNAGEAYIFKKDQGGVDNWGLLKTLNSPNQSVSDIFGSVVAIDGNYIVVSAWADGGSTELITGAGEAYIFKKDQGGADNWGLLKTLNSPNESTGDTFGSAIDIKGEYIIIGAPNDDGSAESLNNSGEAYIFKKDQGGVDNWGLIKTLNSPNENSSDKFGQSVGVSESYAVVGAFQDDGSTDVLSNAGEAYIFKKDQGGIDNWGLLKILNSPNENSSDSFGYTVDVDGNYILVTAYGDGGSSESTTDSGEAYIFKKDQGGADNWGLLKILNSPNESIGDYFGSASAISGDYIIIGAYSDDGSAENLNNAGEAYIFKKDQGGIDNWGLVKTLNSSNPNLGDLFAWDVDIGENYAIAGTYADSGSTESITFAGEAYIFKLNSSPINTALALSWSPDNKILAVAHQTSPFISLYEVSNDIFSQLSNPLGLPTGTGNDCKFTNDSRFLAVAHDTTPFISIYERNNLTFAKLANPSFLPTNSGLSCAWSPDSRFLVVGQLLTPFINLYERSGSTFIKLPNPSTLPTGNGRDVDFSPDGRFMAIAHGSAPYLTIYEILGNSFVKISDPPTLPTSNLFTLSWSPTGKYLAVAGNYTLVVYKVTGSTFTSIYSINPLDNCNKVFWSRDEKNFGVCLSSTPFVRFYNLNNDVITPEATVIDSNLVSPNCASWSQDNRFLAVAYSFSPYLNIYETSAEKPVVTDKNLKILSRK